MMTGHWLTSNSNAVCDQRQPAEKHWMLPSVSMAIFRWPEISLPSVTCRSCSSLSRMRWLIMLGLQFEKISQNLRLARLLAEDYVMPLFLRLQFLVRRLFVFSQLKLDLTILYFSIPVQCIATNDRHTIPVIPVIIYGFFAPTYFSMP